MPVLRPAYVRRWLAPCRSLAGKPGTARLSIVWWTILPTTSFPLPIEDFPTLFLNTKYGNPLPIRCLAWALDTLWYRVVFTAIVDVLLRNGILRQSTTPDQIKRSEILSALKRNLGVSEKIISHLSD
jgi:hypothetical protein